MPCKTALIYHSASQIDNNNVYCLNINVDAYVKQSIGYITFFSQVTYEDCAEVVKTCKDNGVYLAVCHVLRYTPQARKIRDVIQSGAIGDVVNIQLLEPVSLTIKSFGPI